MNGTILLVDDEANVLSALSRALFEEPSRPAVRTTH